MTSKQIQELMQEVEKNPWAGPSANDLVSLCQTALDALQRVEELEKLRNEYKETDKACWYHALTWLLEQDGDIRANAEKHIAELTKDLDL